MGIPFQITSISPRISYITQRSKEEGQTKDAYPLKINWKYWNLEELENRCLNEKSRNISKNGKVMSTNTHFSPLHGFSAEKQIIFVKISES